jgi:hypothetical protein
MTEQTTASTTGSGLAPAPVAALDVLARTLSDVDGVAHALVRALQSLGALDVVIASHVVQSGHAPHQVATVSALDLEPSEVEATLRQVGSDFDVSAVLGVRDFDGPSELRDGLEEAVAAHRSRTVGRVVVFPGDHVLLGTVSVADVTLWSDIDRVELVTGGPVDAGIPLVTRDFLRPRWDAGALVLHVQPAAGGTVVPFETPSPTPCCADHV